MLTTQELIEGIKTIIEYDGNAHKLSFHGLDVLRNSRYHDSFDWQVPVWARARHDTMNLKMDGAKFCKWLNFQGWFREAIDNDDKDRGFEVLVETIQWLTQQPSFKDLYSPNLTEK
jgi:hypothetical protein